MQENTRQLALALETVEKISGKVASPIAHSMLTQLKNLAASYQTGMEFLAKKMSTNSQVAHGEFADQFRYQGQEMAELSEELVSFEHNQIRII